MATTNESLEVSYAKRSFQLGATEARVRELEADLAHLRRQLADRPRIDADDLDWLLGIAAAANDLIGSRLPAPESDGKGLLGSTYTVRLDWWKATALETALGRPSAYRHEQRIGGTRYACDGSPALGEELADGGSRWCCSECMRPLAVDR
jgi:hypothetical protein